LDEISTSLQEQKSKLDYIYGNIVHNLAEDKKEKINLIKNISNKMIGTFDKVIVEARSTRSNFEILKAMIETQKSELNEKLET